MMFRDKDGKVDYIKNGFIYLVPLRAFFDGTGLVFGVVGYAGGMVGCYLVYELFSWINRKISKPIEKYNSWVEQG